MDEQLAQWAESVRKQHSEPKYDPLLKMLNNIPISPQLVDSQDIPPLG